jgi:hypothetical protein
MERDQSIAREIREAREAARGGPTVPRQYDGAQDYLLAVIRGEEVPDPIRVGAARALLPFLEPRRRATKKSASPRQMQHQDALATENALLDQWAEKAARVRRRLQRT